MRVVAWPRCGDGGGAGSMCGEWMGLMVETVLKNTPGDGRGNAMEVLRDGWGESEAVGMVRTCNR